MEDHVRCREDHGGPWRTMEDHGGPCEVQGGSRNQRRKRPSKRCMAASEESTKCAESNCVYREVTMPSRDLMKGVHRTVITLGLAFILIGVVLLTVSDSVFILGIVFLCVGVLAVLGYLLATLSSCLKKSRRMNNVENPEEAENRPSGQRQVQPDNTQLDAPSYDEVILYGSARVWTVSLAPPLPEIEPPPYNSALAHRRGVLTDLRIQNPVLLRVSSDIHELKGAGLIPDDRWLEPLTPPPTYHEIINETSNQEEERDFESTREEG